MPPRILMLSLSRDLAESPAPDLNEAQLRQRLYAGFCESVDIIVKSAEAHPGPQQIGSNLRIHSTGSLNNIRAAWKMWTAGSSLIQERGANLLVAQEPFLTGLIGTLLARRWNLPLVLHYVCDFFDNQEWLRERWSHRFWNRVGKWVARRAAVVRIDSEDQRDRLAAVGVHADRVHYVPFLQFDLEKFSDAPPDTALRQELLSGGDAVILTVARLEPQKDLDTLLAVADEVARLRPGARFVVLGDGPERGRIERLIQSRDLSRWLQLRGWVDFARLPAYFSAADLFLLTSRYETSARVLVLARVAGIPIVTTAVSGAAALATAASGSAVAPVGDVSALAGCVVQRIDKRRQTRLQATGVRRAIVAEYSEAAIVERMRQLCASALSTPRRRPLPKLVYVLPKFDRATGEHFLHTYGLLESLSERTELAVIVERAIGRPAFGGARVYAQQWASIPPLRFLEILWLCLRLRMNGHRTFYVHYSYFGAASASLITRAFGGRVFYWHCVSTFFKKTGWSPGALAHWFRAEAPLALTVRFVDHVVTGTRSLADLYTRTFGIPADRFRVVPNDIRPERFELAAMDRDRHRDALGFANDFVVLFVHRLAPRKGAQYLVPIARGLLDVVPHARFVIAGDGPMYDGLRREIEHDASLASRVQLLGSVPNADVAAWFAAADAFVMPSEEEGFPRVLLECMAAGLPFVAADVGGVRDICNAQQQRGIVPVGDVNGFIECLVWLEGDAAARRRLAAAGRARVQSYTTEAVVACTLQQLDLEARPVAPTASAAGASLNT